MKRRSLFFDGPGRVALREDPIPDPSEAEVLVRTVVSAISAGSELLVYRDQFPPHVAVDATIESLTGSFSFPMKYGYACVGEVISLGPGVDPLWQGRKVFSFQPHQSCFITKVSDLFPLPAGMGVLDAVFLPFMETAVTLLLDGKPAVGEQVAVFGQGVVGLLVTATPRADTPFPTFDPRPPFHKTPDFRTTRGPSKYRPKPKPLSKRSALPFRGPVIIRGPTCPLNSPAALRPWIKP